MLYAAQAITATLQHFELAIQLFHNKLPWHISSHIPDWLELEEQMELSSV